MSDGSLPSNEEISLEGFLLTSGDIKAFNDIRRLYQKAEDKLKLIERLHNEGLVVPSVNELRYAGYHIVQAITAQKPEIRKEEITKAENHCRRAVYDALEVGILDRLEAVRCFEDDYRLVEIPPVIKDYLQLRQEIRAAQRFIESTGKENRESYYDQCEQHFESLAKIADILDDARPELNKILRKQRNSFMITIITIALSFVGILATIFIKLFIH